MAPRSSNPHARLFGEGTGEWVDREPFALRLLPNCEARPASRRGKAPPPGPGG